MAGIARPHSAGLKIEIENPQVIKSQPMLSPKFSLRDLSRLQMTKNAVAKINVNKGVEKKSSNSRKKPVTPKNTESYT